MMLLLANNIFGKHVEIFHSFTNLTKYLCVLYRGKMIWKQGFMKRVCSTPYLICLWQELRPHLPLYCGPLYT